MYKRLCSVNYSKQGKVALNSRYFKMNDNTLKWSGFTFRVVCWADGFKEVWFGGIRQSFSHPHFWYKSRCVQARRWSGYSWRIHRGMSHKVHEKMPVRSRQIGGFTIQQIFVRMLVLTLSNKVYALSTYSRAREL